MNIIFTEILFVIVQLFVNNTFTEILFLIQTGLRGCFKTRRYSLNSQRYLVSNILEMVLLGFNDVNS